MKNIFLILSLILFTTFSYSQSFKAVKIDSLVSVSLPSIYVTKDTANQRIFSGRSSFGYIVVVREPNATNNSPLKKEKDLNKVFKDYANGIMKLSGGTILNKRDTIVGTLKGLLFTLHTDNGDGNAQYRRFLLLYTRDVTYTFEYYYADLQSALINDEVKTYFGSIKLSPDLQRNDQYLSMSSASSGWFDTSKIMIFIGAIIIIIVTVYMAVGRKKRFDDEDITD